MGRRVDILTPDLGPGADRVSLSLWLVEPSAEVTVNDRLAELLVGPATVDVAAPASGLLREILVEEDDPVVPGQVLGWIEELD